MASQELPSNCTYHILLWNYREGVTAEEQERLMKLLENLPNRIPGLESVRWGAVTGGRNQVFSHSFVMVFDTKESLAGYATHPNHLAFAGPFREACATQVVVDFET